MTAAYITLELLVDGQPQTPQEVWLRDETQTYAIQRTSDGATVVAPVGPLSATAPGVYQYDISGLPTGEYLAVWEVLLTDGTREYHRQAFAIDAVEALTVGVTLQEVEQAAAAALGPYIRCEASGGTDTSVLCAEFVTTLPQYTDAEDLFLLRRGVDAQGRPVLGFDHRDRVRQVASVDTARGELQVDAAYRHTPVAGEMIELHYLHPQRELRPCVLEGLRRCYLPDQATITPTGAAAERDLTTSLPWLTHPRQLQKIELVPNSAGLLYPAPLWFRATLGGGHVRVQIAPDPYPFPFRVTALRPASSKVNGSYSELGPDDDSDQLDLVDRQLGLRLAAAAAHLVAFQRLRARLLPAARQGLARSPRQVALEFTRLSQLAACREPARFELPTAWAARGDLRVVRP